MRYTSVMFLGARVAVVVPAYDEERLVARTLRSVPAFVDAVFVVDDASRDRTADEARAVGDARVVVLAHAENRGVGAAIATGYRAARAAGADVIAVMAGDAQMDPRDLAALVAPVARGELGYAKGDRLHHPDVWRAMPKARLVGSLVLSRLTAAAAGVPGLSDSQCGYTAIDARALDRIDLDALWPRYGYPNDLLARLARAGVPIGDVVVRPVYADETSGLRARHVLRIVRILARAAVDRADERRRPPPAAWAPRGPGAPLDPPHVRC